MYKLYTKMVMQDLSRINELPKNVIEHINTHKDAMDRLRSYTGYIMLMDEIGSYQINLEGKPYIDGVFFNISHDANMVVLAISDDKIGVDVMKIRDIDSRILSYIGIDSNMSEYEKIKLWCRLESAIKYEGLSITSIKKIDTSSYLYDIIEKDDYLIAVCYGRGNINE